MNLKLITNLFPFCDIKSLVKISMTNKRNSRIIYEIINNNFIKTKIIVKNDVEEYYLKKYDIMCISNFVKFIFDNYISSYTPCSWQTQYTNPTIKALKNTITFKDSVRRNFYIDIKSSNFFSNNINRYVYYYEEHLKFSKYAKYMKCIIEKKPLLFKLGTRGFRYHDFWGKKALDADIRNFRWVSRRLRTNEHYAKLAVEYNGLFLQYANKLRNNKSICLIAMEQNIKSFKYIWNSLKQDKEFLKEVFYKNQEYWIDLLLRNSPITEPFKLILKDYDGSKRPIKICNQIFYI